MTAPLSVAIIGAGSIAGGFDERRRPDDTGVYSHAGAYAAHGGFELKTVLDTDPGRAEAFQRFWQVGRRASSPEEVYGGFHDVISVCSPDSCHFDTVREILTRRCCRTVFVEKPLAPGIGQIEELIALAAMNGMKVVVNFQRRNETGHRELRSAIASRPGELLSVSCHYMKGLNHTGVTMIDTLCYLCGYPEAVLAYHRALNEETGDYSYEFVLFYDGFTVGVKTTDAARFRYNYHLFEIDLLFCDRRTALVDISQGIRESPVTGYAYSGVKIMNERQARYRETGYKTSMVDAVAYLHDITTGTTAHETNTPQSSYNNSIIINRIIESFERGSVKLNMEHALWKR